MSENWSQGGSGGQGEDPYGREPRPENTGGSGRGRRRAGGPPPEGADGRRPQRPQDPYGAGAFDSASYGSGQGQTGQGRYGLGAFDPAGPAPYGPGGSGSYDTGSYDTGARRPAPGRSGGYPTDPRGGDPRAADPYATGGFPTAGAPPRRPQGQPGQPSRTQPGRPPYGAAPQPARSPYGRDGYDTGGGGGGYDSEGYESGEYETGQFDRRQPERPAYDRQPRDRAAQPYERQPYDPDGYERDPYRDDARSASAVGATGGRRRAADPVVPDEDGYDRAEFDADPPPRSRRRSARRDEAEAEEDFNFIDAEEQDDDDGAGRSGRRPKQPKSGRNCLAVLVAFLVVAGLLGGTGYWGYKHFSHNTAPPPDYTASTNPDLIDVIIPPGAGGSKIGSILYGADVIKSEGAFINACAANLQCAQIQANTYLLPKEISAAAAVNLLLNPSNVDKKGVLNTYGGERAAQVFGSVEAKKGWSAAQIAAAMNSGQIDLPSWDTGKAGTNYPWAPIEGFIAAEQYNLSSYSTPQALLKKMVDDQLALLTTQNFATKAQSLNVSEYQLLIIASMAQAEAANANDLPNIAEVVFNRLKDTAYFSHLGFDTVTLYGMGNTVTAPTAADLRDTSNPYNTHLINGLPPSPIGNPDASALTAASNPAQNKNEYFCAINSTTTVYATSSAGWTQIGQEYPKQCGGG